MDDDKYHPPYVEIILKVGDFQMIRHITKEECERCKFDIIEYCLAEMLHQLKKEL